MRTIRLVLGSTIVYMFVACASALSSDSPPQPSFDGSAQAESGGSDSVTPAPPTGKESGIIGAIADAITDPVSEANAQSLPPITAMERCDKMAAVGDSGTTVAYAEHAFPGYTVQQLARAVAIVTWSANFVFIPGYTQSVQTPFVRDGYVAIDCGSATSPEYSSVTFMLPQ
jgi:hypothetical protein